MQYLGWNALQYVPSVQNGSDTDRVMEDVLFYIFILFYIFCIHNFVTDYRTSLIFFFFFFIIIIIIIIIQLQLGAC